MACGVAEPNGRDRSSPVIAAAKRGDSGVRPKDTAADGGGSLGAAAGPQRFYRTGFSLGGILTSTLMALEPETTTGAVVVPGGGMAADILLRIDLRPVSDPVFHELLGPVVVAEPVDGSSSRYALSFLQRKKLDVVHFGVDPSMIDNTHHVAIGSDIPSC